MIKFLLTLFTFFSLGNYCFAQNNFSPVIKDGETGEPLSNVSVILKGTGKGASSDINGKAIIKNIPNGKQSLLFSSIGFKDTTVEINFPLITDSVFTINLIPDGKEIEQVVISSSRTESRIENTPTRVEVLGGEEVEEESGVKPAHVASLLGDVAGIQSQQTSAVTGNTDLRIQGLPGDYTQILRDGVPLFGGYGGSFSILQIPPLDLKQIEIIKGASSTLYGGGAIAGMINIISKKPKQGVKERFILLNRSTLKENNVNIYLSERDKKMGYTFFAGGTIQKEVDVNNDGFSDVAATENLFFHPVFYFYPNDKNTFSLGINSIFEERRGGDMLVLNKKPTTQHQFYIENQSLRNTLETAWDKKIKSSEKFSLKFNLSNYKRDISTNVFGMRAKQLSYYSEASYVKKAGKHDVVMGINFNGENFKKGLPDSSTINNYNYTTLGVFVQDDWRVHPKFTIETGLRTDFHNQYGTFVLPRFSLLYKITPSITSRLGGGMGYKIPTLFNSDVDERNYANLNLSSNVKAERSTGANLDINFKKQIGEVELAINQSFYITNINNPLVAVTSPGSIFYFTASKPIVTKGFETWMQITYDELEAYIGYTLADAKKKYDAINPNLELSARDKFAAVVSYEFSKRFRACIEAAYTGTQYLEDRSKTPAYLFAAGMIRYDINRFSFVLNCENVFDYRQTRKELIVIPPTTNPAFKQLWAPIDGRVVNLSVKIKL